MSRKRCDFKTRKRCDLKSRPPKNRCDLYSESLSTFDLSLLFHRQKNIAGWNSRFRNAAICDFIPRLFCDFSAEPAVRVLILSLRFENAAIAIAFFWDAKCGNHHTQRILGQLLRSLLQNPRNFAEVGSEVRPVVHTALLCLTEAMRLVFSASRSARIAWQ